MYLWQFYCLQIKMDFGTDCIETQRLSIKPCFYHRFNSLQCSVTSTKFDHVCSSAIG